MVTRSLCSCICGSGQKTQGPLDPAKTFYPGELQVLDEVDELPFELPRFAGRLSYSISVEQPLRGMPIREGEMWHLCSAEKVELVHFSLYVNGFTFATAEEESSISVSPFALVRKCKFQNPSPSLKIPDLQIFKVALFSQGLSHFFGLQSDEDRGQWVNDISQAIRLVTQSIFPQFTISCQPLDSVISTHRRIMAGYLAYRDDDSVASVLFAELHPHSEDKAKLAFYDNEFCLTPVMDVYITERSLCCEKMGINCSCFSIGEYQFSTRTQAERKLWLRAISNLKVKIQHRAPSPTDEDLGHYRLAIEEYIASIRANLGHVPMDALLQCHLQKLCVPYGAAAPVPGLAGSVTRATRQSTQIVPEPPAGAASASAAQPPAA
mmetsp:Transcript_14412/g.41061  ORF Transcript_14412/g.41061 Transcript_14412/m.41061 type:complete len:379 (-) Transcript_14412:20-1156(-)